MKRLSLRTLYARTTTWIFDGLRRIRWLRFTMKRDNRDYTIYDIARESIDEDGLERLLRMAAETDELDEEAVSALHAVTTDTLVADALAAAAHAEWRGRAPTGDDVGVAAERRRSCCDDKHPEGPMVAKILKGVW